MFQKSVLAKYLKQLDEEVVSTAYQKFSDYFLNAGLQAEIDKTDREIDGMVYELYGLSGEEIGIIESSIAWNWTNEEILY